MRGRIEQIIEQMSVDELGDLVAGAGMWHTRPNPRLGIPAMKVTDGPNGARGGGLMGTGTPTACIPAGSVLGATWDPELVERLGVLLGEESIAKGSQVLLAPTVNLHRHPLGGRNFECYSEDPYLSARLAVGFVQGVQRTGVATAVKHLVANDSEFERDTIDSHVDERTLREVYLLPFEACVTDGGAWGVMSSYNRVNGVYASEHEWLLQEVLRREWGFDGFVISDWFATRSTAASVRAGLSLEMPGPGRFYGAAPLREAVEAGEIERAHLQAAARDVLTVMDRTGILDTGVDDAETVLDRPGDRALTREAAAAGTVLVTNDGILPLDRSTIGSLAVIGPNARQATIMGGGSATVRSYPAESPLEALERRLGSGMRVRYARGCSIDRTTPPLGPPMLDGGLRLEFFDNDEWRGDAVATSTADSARILFFGAPVPEVTSHYSLRATGTIIAQESGAHVVSMVQCGRARVVLDGVVVLDGTEGQYGRSDEFFGFATEELSGEVQLEAGQPIGLVVELSSRDALVLSGVRVGLESVVEPDLLGEASRLAQESDAALVVVGTNDDWETEGRDRDLWELPGDQVELIASVCRVNPRTIVVVNTGGPHDMGWLDRPAATLIVGFGGQEMANALVDVLVGDVDPGGRMPTTIPARSEHAPAFLDYPGENSVARYGEGVFVGHRWYDARHIAPAVPFGHGLSYTTVEWGEPRVDAAVPTTFDELRVELDLTNTGGRAGSEVVQLYVEPPAALLRRPLRELKGFQKCRLSPGETATVTLSLTPRSFAYFDPGDREFEHLAAAAPVPRAAGRRHVDAGWYVEPGTYRLVLGRSVTDPVHVAEIVLDGAEVRLDP